MLSLLGDIMIDGVVYEPRVRYSQVNQLLEYQDSGGDDWQTLASSVQLSASRQSFHILKLVYDLTAEEYIRCMLDSETYSMSGIGLHVDSGEGADRVFVSLRADQESATTGRIYIDDVILTCNEE